MKVTVFSAPPPLHLSRSNSCLSSCSTEGNYCPTSALLIACVKTSGAISSKTDTTSSSTLSPRLVQLSYQMSRGYFLDYILRDKKARKVFMAFLKKRHCAESLMFWIDVERYRRLGNLCVPVVVVAPPKSERTNLSSLV